MNKAENIVVYKDMGEVRYIQNSRARRLSIRISQLGEVSVTMPRRVSIRRAEAFLASKSPWILKKLSEINQLNHSLPDFKVGNFLNVHGTEIPILLQKGENSVEDAIWRILRETGQAYLPERVRMLAEKHGFEYSGVKIRKMKTRWGSCTAKNSINLNSWLMMLPEVLADYVILHELVHTIHRDHSRNFWNALDEVMGGSSKALRKALRKERIMLINTKN